MRRAPLVLALLAVAGAAGGYFACSRSFGTGGRSGRRVDRNARPALVEGPAAYTLAPAESLAARLLGGLPAGAEPILRVFTPLPPGAEFTLDSPSELRVAGGDAGAKGAFDALDGMAGALLALAEAPGIPPAFAESLRAAIDRLEKAADGEFEHPMRATFQHGKVPMLKLDYYGTGLALSDRGDPHLDSKRPRFATGVRILVNRIEGAAKSPGAPPEIASGLVTLAGDGVHGTGAGSEFGLSATMSLPLGALFALDRAPSAGIGLGPDGSIVVFGFAAEVERLPPNPKLLAAILAVLRRI